MNLMISMMKGLFLHGCLITFCSFSSCYFLAEMCPKEYMMIQYMMFLQKDRGTFESANLSISFKEQPEPLMVF